MIKWILIIFHYAIGISVEIKDMKEYEQKKNLGVVGLWCSYCICNMVCNRPCSGLFFPYSVDIPLLP